MWRRRLFRVVLLTVVSASALAVSGQEPDPIKWSIKASPSTAEKKTFAIELTARIDAGWHLYSTEKIEGGPSPTRITLLPGQNFEVAGDIDSPAPRSAYDPNFQVATEFYEGIVPFTIPIKSTAPSAASEKVRVQVRYQTCTPTICLPPKLIELETAVSGEETQPVQMPTAPENPATLKSITTGALVPDFNFTDFNGKLRRFSEFRGRVVLLDFWASWCSPCLADIPQLKNAYQKYHAAGFEIIGMDSETLGQKEIDPEFAKEAQIKAREIVSTRGVIWTQATADSSLPIAVGSFGVENLPAKVLIDRSGKVVARIKNVSELDELLPGLLKVQP
jgi:thiol-disulfide isomerase/thioredoxin